VTDRRGLIIAHQGRASYVENQTDFSAVPTVRAALAGQRGALEFVNPVEDQAKIGGYRPIEGLGWAAAYVVPIRQALAPIDRLTRGIVVSSVALAVAMGGVAAVVAQRIVRPLRQLTTAAHGISVGDYGHRIETRTGDEIEHLADAFNQMAVQLAEKETQLHRHAEELQAANKELEAFSYSVSHDLRAPLRAMDGFSRILLEEEQALSTSSRRYLGLVRDNALQMGHLVDDLLSFSRLSRQSLKRARVEPASLVAQVLEDLRTEHAGRPVEVVVGDLPTCMADLPLLKQVWSNLLANALKFTQRRASARIEVGCREQDGEQAYFVKDNGVGFDMRYADKLFGVFQRLHRAEDYEGTGVGLAIVQRIVHRHGGRVWAEAEEDKGATFHFTLGRPTSAPTEDRL
jgi:signal transduction histidine kinase